MCKNATGAYAMSYTLRIYTNGEGDHIDTVFDDMDEMYNSVFQSYQPDNIMFEATKPGVSIGSGYAVYDNDTGLCINSINAAQVGHSMADPYQPFGPQVLGL